MSSHLLTSRNLHIRERERVREREREREREGGRCQWNLFFTKNENNDDRDFFLLVIAHHLRSLGQLTNRQTHKQTKVDTEITPRGDSTGQRRRKYIQTGHLTKA